MHQLNQLIGEMLDAQDLAGFGFLIQINAQIVSEAVALAAKITEENNEAAKAIATQRGNLH